MGLNVVVKYRLWLEHKGKPLMGKGRSALLDAIRTTGSIKAAARHCGMTEKTAHNYIDRMESRLGERIVSTSKGGKAGGGAALTAAGEGLLERYEKERRRFAHALGSDQSGDR
ncbi:LysR family transcriptional regulator [Candidatus Woesearchaeota archaeon]|nr:LysR family transcriptional regulator [Candidatus Woesearchaeota archaeon]